MDTFTEQFRPWAYHLGVASHRGDALARSLVEGFVQNLARPNAARENRLLSDLSRWIGERLASDMDREESLRMRQVELRTREMTAELPADVREVLALKGAV